MLSAISNEPRIKEKKICFAVLVHNKRELIREMLDNLRYFCPNSDIVLYNGGSDSKLCDGLGFPVCPTSKKLHYGKLALFMIETMEWLEQTDRKYDYLINLDSDALFARKGYEQFIYNAMRNCEYMGVDMGVPGNGWYPGVLFKRERKLWRSLFESRTFIKSFNVGQVFGRKFVKALLESHLLDQLKKNLQKTKCFAIEEIVFANMAKKLGFEPKSYPKETSRSIRYRPHFTYKDFIKYMNERPQCYLFHPVTRSKPDEVRWIIRAMVDDKRGKEMKNWPKYIGGMIFDTDAIRKPPSFTRRTLGKNEWFEMIAPLKQGGLGHWRQNNDSRGDHWFGPLVFGSGKFGSVSVLHSRYNVLELIARKGEQLIHFWRDEAFGSEKWVEQATIGKGAKGQIAFIESRHGNFEVVAPLTGGGLGHWWRDNKSPGQTWHGPTKFGKEQVDAVSLIQNNSGKLIAVTEIGGKLKFYRRDDNGSWS